MKFTITTAAAALALASCAQAPTDKGNESAPAPATETGVPDLKGKWVGTSESVVLGSPKHHAPAAGSKPRLSSVEFTITIDGQDGHRFWGSAKSRYSDDFILGVIKQDGKSILARTSEGEIDGRITGADTIELTYSGSGNATVMSINTWKRQK